MHVLTAHGESCRVFLLQGHQIQLANAFLGIADSLHNSQATLKRSQEPSLSSLILRLGVELVCSLTPTFVGRSRPES